MRAIAILFALLLAAAPAPDALFDAATGYRISAYRAPVTGVPEHVRRIDTHLAAQLWRTHRAVFIDVMPAEGGHRDASTGLWYVAAVRETIPGAAWFPESGRGVPDPAILEGFRAGVAALTRGDRHRRLVVFCRADCWMSWNAARRLAREGHTRVFWYADGTDGWRDADLPLAPATPR